MFHPSTQQLIDYWRERRGSYELPPRSAVDPTDFPDLLPQVFMLGRERAGVYPIRLAGGFVTNLHGRGLRHDNMLTLWTPFDRAPLTATLERCRTRPAPFVVKGEIRAEDAGPVPMEVLFAPLSTAAGGVDRFLGLYQPTAMLHRLKGRAANALAIRSIEGQDHLEAPRLRLAALNGRQIA